MAYDDARFRGGAGFRDDHDGTAESAVSYGTGFSSLSSYAASGTDSPSRHSLSAAQLEDVFDDPEHGDPGRDRLGVHLTWETVLLLAVAGVAYVLYSSHRSAVSGDSLRGLMVDATVLGLITLGIGLSLRAAAVNLAVGPIAYASALFFTTHAGRGLLESALLTVTLAAVAGIAISVVVAGLHVPAWAASLGAALAVLIWIEKQEKAVTLPAGVYQPTRHAAYWLAGFVVLALAGSLIGLSKGVRRGVARFRPVSDPARRRGATAGVIVSLAILGSSILAGVGGVLLALRTGTLRPPNTALLLTGMSLGAALLGGTSAFGRRGGIFGTVLAVALITLVTTYADVTRRNVAPFAIAASAIGIGLLATRLVETFGRPLSAAEAGVDAPWAAAPTEESTESGWTPSRPAWGGAQSGEDDRWVGEDRWNNR